MSKIDKIDVKCTHFTFPTENILDLQIKSLVSFVDLTLKSKQFVL